MAHRRSAIRRPNQTQRRKKTWISIKQLTAVGVNPGILTTLELTVTSPGVLGQASRAMFLVAGGDNTGGNPLTSTLPEESTILRIRGSLLFPKTTLTGSLVDTEMAFGVGVTGTSSATSSGSYPAPITDSDWDGWMFRRQSAVSPVDSIGTVVDIKAMRKIQSGEALFFMAEAVDGGSTADVGTWIFDMRVLLLLP